MAVDRKAASQLLGQALNSLSHRDKEIVRLRYGKAMPFHEIEVPEISIEQYWASSRKAGTWS